MKRLRIGRVTASDRASAGIYADASGPEIENRINPLFAEYERVWFRRVLPDEQQQIEAALRELVDREGCHLIVTTGGTGPGFRDVMPEATRAVIERELPGFGEILRVRSFDRVPTSILSRATAGIRGRCLIVNLPGRPSAVSECLAILGEALVKTLLILGERSSEADTTLPKE